MSQSGAPVARLLLHSRPCQRQGPSRRVLDVNRSVRIGPIAFAGKPPNLL